MKEFLAGLIFLIAVFILTTLGILIFPLLVAMMWLLRLVITLVLVILSIWLLGKFIIWVWEKMIK